MAFRGRGRGTGANFGAPGGRGGGSFGGRGGGQSLTIDCGIILTILQDEEDSNRETMDPQMLF